MVIHTLWDLHSSQLPHQSARIPCGRLCTARLYSLERARKKNESYLCWHARAENHRVHCKGQEAKPKDHMSTDNTFVHDQTHKSALRMSAPSQGGGDSPKSYCMPLPISLYPQNYSRGQDKAVCSFCTSLVHPAYGGGVHGRVLDLVPGCVWLVYLT
jgi:hypothetical protein